MAYTESLRPAGKWKVGAMVTVDVAFKAVPVELTGHSDKETQSIQVQEGEWSLALVEYK